MTSPSGGNQYQQVAGAPGTPTGPKITSIFDFSEEALEQVAFWLEQRGLHIPITQILGFAGFTANVNQVIDNASRTSGTFGDLSTGAVGPQVTGLPDGKYALLWAGLVSPSGGGTGQMGVSVNGDDPASVGATNLFSNGSIYFGVKFTTRTLSAGGNNTVKCVYRNSAGFTVTAQDRSLLVLKYANL